MKYIPKNSIKDMDSLGKSLWDLAMPFTCAQTHITIHITIHINICNTNITDNITDTISINIIGETSPSISLYRLLFIDLLLLIQFATPHFFYFHFLCRVLQSTLLIPETFQLYSTAPPYTGDNAI